jgi:hypothetical protein
VLAKQALYHLSHTSSPFWSVYFGDGISKIIFSGCPTTSILPISAYQVAGITGIATGRFLINPGFPDFITIILKYLYIFALCMCVMLTITHMPGKLSTTGPHPRAQNLLFCLGVWLFTKFLVELGMMTHL